MPISTLIEKLPKSVWESKAREDLGGVGAWGAEGPPLQKFSMCKLGSF